MKAGDHKGTIVSLSAHSTALRTGRDSTLLLIGTFSPWVTKKLSFHGGISLIYIYCNKKAKQTNKERRRRDGSEVKSTGCFHEDPGSIPGTDTAVHTCL